MQRSLGSGGRSTVESQFEANFFAADEDKDKLLNFDEYLVFIEKEKEAMKLRKEPEIERTEEQHRAMYNAINKMTPDVDGVSKSELTAVMKYAYTYVTGALRHPTNSISP